MIGQRTLTDVVILSPRGTLMGGPETTEFRTALDSLLEKGLKKVVVDLKDVRWVNAAGIGILIETLDRVRETKGDLKLANCCSRIGHVFKLLKMDTVFQHFDTLDNALSSFA